MSNLGKLTGAASDGATPAQDLAAWDQLGPLARHVLNEEMLVQWSATSVLKKVRVEWKSDPLDPPVDRRLAEYLRFLNAEVRRRMRDEIWATK